MARVVSVSEVRSALYWAAGGPSSTASTARSSAVFGTFFHTIFSGLTGADEAVNLVRPLENAHVSLDAWKAALESHTYAWHVAPLLEKQQPQLTEAGADVLHFWRSVQSLCGWLAEIMWTQRDSGRSLAESRGMIFRHSEADVAITLSDDAWTSPVMVSGRPDALLQHPEKKTFCIVELKTGETAPEADVAQAVLYQMIVSGNGDGAVDPDSADVALVRFTPEPHEQRFTAAALAEARALLIRVVGHIAGATPAIKLDKRDATLTLDETADVPAPGRKRADPVQRVAAARAKEIVTAFKDCGVVVRISDPPLVGPSFVRYFLDVEAGVPVRKITQLDETIWVRLETEQPPQISIDRGRVVFDLERTDRETFFWRDLSLARVNGGSSRFPVGVAINGTLQWADFSSPQDSHFLVAGTAGSGKSEWLRAAAASVVAQNTPDDARLLLIDPKRTAFHVFEGSDYLWRDVVYPDEHDIVTILSELIDEMERRYRLLADAGVPHLAAYNQSESPRLPRIICFCDEYADLLLGDKARRKVIEPMIGRLGAKGRAAGVHLVFATQRPSRDLISGIIDANLMARVCLRVVTSIQSRLVIEEPTGKTLLGRGDLLFKDLGAPVRLQSPFITEEELRDLVAATAE